MVKDHELKVKKKIVKRNEGRPIHKQYEIPAFLTKCLSKAKPQHKLNSCT